MYNVKWLGVVSVVWKLLLAIMTYCWEVWTHRSLQLKGGGGDFGGCDLLLGCMKAHVFVIKRAVLRRSFVSKFG